MPTTHSIKAVLLRTGDVVFSHASNTDLIVETVRFVREQKGKAKDITVFVTYKNSDVRDAFTQDGLVTVVR